MKVWLKLLIGAAIGALLAYFLPETPALVSAVTFLKGLALGMGRYTAVPLLAFSLTIGIYELRQNKKFLPLMLRTFLIMAVVSAFVIALGLCVPLVFPPGRIPVLVEQQTEKAAFFSLQNIADIFPSNMLSIFSNGGLYLLPLCAAAFFIAAGLRYGRGHSKPVIALLDSLSRVFLHITAFFSEVLGLIIIALSAFWAIQLRDTAPVFLPVIRLLLIFSLVLTGIVLPALLLLVKRRHNPWKTLYGSLGPAIAAFFSGDYNFSVSTLLLHTKENIGVHRNAAPVTTALFSSFGRSGSAATACAAFIVITQSYSSLGLPVSDIVSIGLGAFVVSFMLAANSADAAFIALAVLCMRYGHGFETGYLILKPIAFYLIAIGTFLDAVIAALGSFAAASLSGLQEDKKISHFI